MNEILASFFLILSDCVCSFCPQETGTIYTHHQKSVIVDADADNYRRKIVAFVGGLDLCKGRYDTPKHPIFSTLQTVHKDDYHNPNFTVIFYELYDTSLAYDLFTYCRVYNVVYNDLLNYNMENKLSVYKIQINRLKSSSTSLSMCIVTLNLAWSYTGFNAPLSIGMSMDIQRKTYGSNQDFVYI